MRFVRLLQFGSPVLDVPDGPRKRRGLAVGHRRRAGPGPVPGRCVVAILGVGAYGSTVLATPPSGVTPALLAKGSLEEPDAKAKTGDWKARLKTTGSSELEVLEVRCA